jgi:PAS domain S-box-containing protein
MNPVTNARTHTALGLATSLACFGAAGTAALALVGWQFDISILRSPLSGHTPMNPVTAVSLILASASLWALRRAQPEPGTKRFAQASALLVVAIGSLKLFSVLTSIGLPLDQVLFQRKLAALPLPNQMAPNTALALVLLGGALIVLSSSTLRVRRLAQPLLLATLAMSLMALFGYVLGARSLYWTASFMAANTAFALLLLTAGALLTQPDSGVCEFVLSPSPGGIMVRRMLPAAIVVPLALSWLRMAGQRRGLYEHEIGTALNALVIAGILVGLIWQTGRSLEAVDRERRRVEEALQKSLKHQSRLLESNLLGVVTANTQGWITEANPTFLAMVGYGHEELPLRAETLTPPDWLGRNETALREIIERGAATPFEKEYVRKDGVRVPVLVGAGALPDTDGEIVAFVLDISKKKQAELEIDRMRRFHDSVVENLPNMLFVKDASDLRFVRINRAAEELLGYGREELLGKSDYDFFPKDQADFFTSKDREILTSGTLADIQEEVILTRAKGPRLLHTKKVPIPDANGKPAFLLGISEDITEKREAEKRIEGLNLSLKSQAEQLEVANNELEAFSYSVSHDLRAPLRHIAGFVDLLLRHNQAQLDETGQRRLKLINESAGRMAQLIDDLLVFSRMGRAELQRSRVDLNAVVKTVLGDLEEETRGRRIRWVVGRLPQVEGDPSMLRLALTNLVGNAVKYTSTREEAVIEIGAIEGAADGIEVFVRDNGVGFDMTYVEKLFGVFQRLHRQEEFSGTGIGLANVRRIVHRHGGRTWAEGALDQGATFHFSLPRHDEGKEDTPWAA